MQQLPYINMTIKSPQILFFSQIISQFTLLILNAEKFRYCFPLQCRPEFIIIVTFLDTITRMVNWSLGSLTLRDWQVFQFAGNNWKERPTYYASISHCCTEYSHSFWVKQETNRIFVGTDNIANFEVTSQSLEFLYFSCQRISLSITAQCRLR